MKNNPQPTSPQATSEDYILRQEMEKRKILESCANICALEWNLDRNEFWWSDHLYSMLNLDPNSVQPSLHSLIGFLHPADQRKAQEEFERLSQNGGHFRLHSHALTKNGRAIPVILMAKIDENANRMIGYLQDVSNDYQERASLRDTLAKYRGVMSGAGDAIILLSHDGKLIEGNAKAAELLETSSDKIADLEIDDIHNPDDLDALMGYYQGFLWGQDQSIRSAVKGQKGRITPVEISGRPVNIGSRQVLVVIMRDVTAQQQAQQALVRSEKRYRILVDEAREGILLLDSDDQIMAANPKMCESTGLKRTNLLQCNFTDITDFDMEVSPTELLLQDDTRASIHMEGHLLNKQGDLLPTGFNVARYKEQGDVHFIVTAYDLTTVRSGEEDRLTLQKQLFQAQKQELLGQVAGSLAHDFNNLLSPILLVSEMLSEETADEPFLHENLNNINQAAQRARRLVHRILTYTRPEESEPSRIDLKAEIQETITLLRSSVPPSIAIKDRCQEEPFSCFADPDQIHQVIMNIGMNAAQSIGANKGTITIDMSKIHIDEESPLISEFEIPEGDYATICIADTGPGIPQDILNEIFDPFFTTKSQTDGSGLGLSVVMQIVKNHGGAVDARSREFCTNLAAGETATPCGACLCVYLPLLKE